MKTYHIYGLQITSAFAFSYPLVMGLELSTPEIFTSKIFTSKIPSIRFVCRVIDPPPTIAEKLFHFSAEDLLSLSIMPTDDGYIMHFDPVMCFTLTQAQIHCDLYRADYDFMVEIHLLGVILAFWLAWQGRICLHAAAVNIEGKSIGFIGDSGAGKSSVAASFVQAGMALVTDDILPVSVPPIAQPLAFSGFPLMRLWLPQAQHFWGTERIFDAVHRISPKVRVPINDFCAMPQPLGAIFLLDRQEALSEIELILSPSSQALFSLAAFEFMAPWQHLLTNRGEQFNQLAQLVQDVPIYRLRYPSGYEHLPAVQQRIIEEFRKVR